MPWMQAGRVGNDCALALLVVHLTVFVLRASWARGGYWEGAGSFTTAMRAAPGSADIPVKNDDVVGSWRMVTSWSL